jgi:uroporphyrinogen decarboxylase
MNSRERILTTLDHREPDRIPFDLGSCQVTGIHVVAYQNLRQALGLPEVKIKMCDAVQQLASIDDDFGQRLDIDTRGLYPLNSHNWQVVEEDAGEYWAYHDEWGITHHRPKESGLYFSVVKVPLPRTDLTVADISNYSWPDVGNPQRMAGMRKLAEHHRAAGYAVVLKDAFAGIFEFAQRIVGMENLLMMMITNEKACCALFDKLLELKLDYWQTALDELGDLVDIVTYADDYGTQTSQIISPDMFRRLIKPRVKTLFEAFAKLAPHARRFFHSDGNVRPLIPDFLEMGVDILNPIHIRAKDMDPAALKRDFGQDLVFWGGGVDTQGVLPNGTPEAVKDNVRRNIEALAPGGGYVFNTIHNIQADVPPENIIAMWEAIQEYGVS